MSLRFADLNPLGRAIIIVVAALTFGVAAISFATSYGALYAYARDTGLYSERLTRLWPLLLDGAFIVAQLAAILAGILRGSRGWPILTMLLTGALTVWFNLQHAGADPGRRLAAALPPVLMMLAFEIDIQIVRWVMTALGRPLGPITPPPPDGMSPGAVWRSDGLEWNVPPHRLPRGWPPDANGPIPAGHHLPENPQNGQTGLPAGTGRERAGVTKRQRIEDYLDRLDPEQLRNLTVRELTAELANEGLAVTERYVKHILDQRRSTPPATAAGEWHSSAAPMTGTEPRRPSTRSRLRPVPEPDRQPPHNLEAEEAVLGAILAAGQLLAEVAGVLEEADFYRPAHRAIWRAILRLADQGQPTDPVTVLGELDHAGELADVGGGPFLHTLVAAVPTVANAGHYAQLVVEAARRRRVIDLGIRLAHSDADPAVLAHLAGELADTTADGVDGRGWALPVPFGATGGTPAFPVEVLPGWLGDYVAAVATATQTPTDLAGMLALAVLATVAASAVEVQPRSGWREPLCLFVAVGMDAGARKSSVFTVLTRPVAEFERQQATAALPAITETITLRRIADQAAAHAEAAASKAPADLQEERQAEAIARAAEAANLIVPPVPRWLVDDATPEALAGLLATYGRIALLSPEGDVFDQMAGRYNQTAGPNLGVYLKGHAGDLLKVDRRGRPPEYVERPCLTIGLTVQPEVLRGLAGRPGFGGRGLLARFLYSLPQSLVGRREVGAPPVPQAMADRYAVELQALAASLSRTPGDDDPTVLTLDPQAGDLLLGFERDLEPRLAAGSGDLAHLAGWAAKLAGATCRLAALLHLASLLRDGWAQPIGTDSFAGAIRLADYLIEHARAVFDLMGTDPRLEDARWLLDWIDRTGRGQFSRRDAHRAAPRGRFAKATDLEPALRLLEEHGYLRRVDPEPSQDPRGRGRPASPRFLVNPLPRIAETTQTTKTRVEPVSVDSVVSAVRGRSPQ